MLGRTLKITAFVTLLALLAAAQTIPAGTHITIRTSQELSSGTAKVGDRFDASLAHALVVGGKTLTKDRSARSRQGNLSQIQWTSPRPGTALHSPHLRRG